MSLDPLSQFKIKKIIDLSLFGADISITNSTIAMLSVVAFIFIFFGIGSRKSDRNHIGHFAALNELIYNFVHGLVKENCGTEGLRFLPFVFSLFIMVAVGNLFGMIPYTFAFTSHIIVTFMLASIVFLSVLIMGFAFHGIGYFRIFLPSGAPLFLAPVLIPIELISFLSRPISLSVRLFANIMAGHMVLKIFAGFVVMLGVFGVIPFAMTTLLTFFEVFVALIQAYIFAILTCVYINDALHLH
jgi:F-type H+-transporting ATPase subunit a